MQQIIKGNEPTELAEYKRKNPTHRYDDLGEDLEQIRPTIRQACLDEQSYLCAYCCRQIGLKDHDCMNEHILPRQRYPQYSFDFTNIVASCTAKGSCDDVKDNHQITISPISPRCETEFEFNISGTIKGLTDDAKQTIEVLKLGESFQQNKKLVEIRNQAIMNYLVSQGINPNDPVEVLDDDLLSLLIEDLQQVTDGKLQPFAPIITKALKNWIDGNK
ncbi:hypothetical protein [Acinetobacter modestus]|uniref:hypothetical protein n=1 Tax=Acinetobacter modestus TaxID=1776740 RepID=UPI001F4B4446|nr:hypothetical protein [Acinetobacter modestus]MCH7334662.1 hypothetical protein [Acinetobacter modestus]